MDGGASVGTVLHRFSVQDYHRIGESGVLDRLRVELIRGAIVDMAPIGTPHVLAVMQLTESFAPLLVGQRVRVSVQNSVRLDGHSEPEPDVLLLAWDADRTAHPSASNALLVVEVADTTLPYDRATKGPLYAQAGIREYWIVNIVERVIEVHRDPGPDGYREIRRVSSGPLTMVALPDFVVTVDDVLPPAGR